MPNGKKDYMPPRGATSAIPTTTAEKRAYAAFKADHAELEKAAEMAWKASHGGSLPPWQDYTFDYRRAKELRDSGGDIARAFVLKDEGGPPHMSVYPPAGAPRMKKAWEQGQAASELARKNAERDDRRKAWESQRAIAKQMTEMSKAQEFERRMRAFQEAEAAKKANIKRPWEYPIQPLPGHLNMQDKYYGK
jgi:hypothetical protein